MTRNLAIATAVACAVIAVVAVIVYALYEPAHPDAARRSKAVAAMAESWAGDIQFEASFDARDPAAVAVEKAKQGGATGAFDPNDTYSGLPRNQGYDDVMAYCAACHSLQIVMQQNKTERGWNALFDLMVYRQGMPAPPAEDRKRIVAYLARNYGEGVR